MHLSDRGGRDRVSLEAAKAPPPIVAPLGGKDLRQLLWWHVKGIAPQPSENVAELGRQEVATIKADHLTKLHRRAAQMRKPIGETGQVTGREQELPSTRPLPRCKPSSTLSQQSASDTASKAAKLPGPGEPSTRNRAALVPAH
jgi:hypothetical protein